MIKRHRKISGTFIAPRGRIAVVVGFRWGDEPSVRQVFFGLPEAG
jgi:hypothetical protein